MDFLTEAPVNMRQLPAIEDRLYAVGSARRTGPSFKSANDCARSRPRGYTNSIEVSCHTQRRGRLSTVLFVAALVVLTTAGEVRATTIDFEGFPDSTILTTQYPGLTFSNTIILTSGISLNEFELPPHSGENVASDNNGPMTIDFSSPITSFSGYFTYLEPLTLDGFDASDTEVASAVSAFSSNDALFGDPGSSPNEFIELDFADGMSSVTITGDPLGGSFTTDDVTYAAVGTAVPEPDSFPLVIMGAAGLLAARIRNKQL